MKISPTGKSYRPCRNHVDRMKRIVVSTVHVLYSKVMLTTRYLDHSKSNVSIASSCNRHFSSLEQPLDFKTEFHSCSGCAPLFQQQEEFGLQDVVERLPTIIHGGCLLRRATTCLQNLLCRPASMCLK